LTFMLLAGYVHSATPPASYETGRTVSSAQPADSSNQVLDQIASVLEHGWKVYSQNLWSFLDATFMLIFAVYFVIRMHALTLLDPEQTILLSRTALDILSCGAPILIPRLAFNIMSENMLFVSLRAMMSDFLTLTALAVWCFAGFLLSMKWLHNGVHSVSEPSVPGSGDWLILFL
jgi:hypothetical protein